jgi:hypothetical protein
MKSLFDKRLQKLEDIVKENREFRIAICAYDTNKSRHSEKLNKLHENSSKRHLKLLILQIHPERIPDGIKYHLID